MISSDAILSVLNFVDGALFFCCMMLVLSLVADAKQDMGIKNLQDCSDKVWFASTSSVRPAIGFISLCMGVIVRTLLIAPTIAFQELNRPILAHQVFDTISPYAYTASTFFFIVGCAFIMWPTLQALPYKLYGNVPKKQAQKLVVGIAVSFLAFLFALGYAFHWALVALILKLVS